MVLLPELACSQQSCRSCLLPFTSCLLSHRQKRFVGTESRRPMECARLYLASLLTPTGRGLAISVRTSYAATIQSVQSIYPWRSPNPTAAAQPGLNIHRAVYLACSCTHSCQGQRRGAAGPTYSTHPSRRLQSSYNPRIPRVISLDAWDHETAVPTWL